LCGRLFISKPEPASDRRFLPWKQAPPARACGGEDGCRLARFFSCGLSKTVVPCSRHAPRRRGIQYSAASRFDRCRLWNTGSPGQAGRWRL